MQTLYHVILYLTNCFINCALIYVAVLAYDTCSILQNDTKKKTQFKVLINLLTYSHCYEMAQHQNKRSFRFGLWFFIFSFQFRGFVIVHITSRFAAIRLLFLGLFFYFT